MRTRSGALPGDGTIWVSFTRPDYWYFGRSQLLDSTSPRFNRGWSQGFGFFVLNVRWLEK